jgi:hypothetical protein
MAITTKIPSEFCRFPYRISTTKHKHKNNHHLLVGRPCELPSTKSNSEHVSFRAYVPQKSWYEGDFT